MKLYRARNYIFLRVFFLGWGETLRVGRGGVIFFLSPRQTWEGGEGGESPRGITSRLFFLLLRFFRGKSVSSLVIAIVFFFSSKGDQNEDGA